MRRAAMLLQPVPVGLADAIENDGDADEAQEWRHIAEAMKMMRGPHQS